MSFGDSGRVDQGLSSQYGTAESMEINGWGS
jgi:hypothetical protein